MPQHRDTTGEDLRRRPKVRHLVSQGAWASLCYLHLVGLCGTSSSPNASRATAEIAGFLGPLRFRTLNIINVMSLLWEVYPHRPENIIK